MIRPLSMILAVAVLAHTLLGCCSHHAHATEPEATEICCHHCHDHEHSDSDSDDAPDSSCGEGNCVFLRGESAPAIDLGIAVVIGWATLPGMDSENSVQLELATRLETDVAQPPLRLHLLHQLLLI